MSETDSIKIELWKAITACAVVGSTLAVGGWNVGRTLLNDEIEQYKKSEKWKIPTAIEQITNLSSKLELQLNEISDYESLKENILEKEKSIALLEQSIQNLEAENIDSLTLLNQRNKKIQTLEAELDNLKGHIITVNVQQAESVGAKSIRVGVSDIAPFADYADVTSGKYSNSRMRVGDSFERIVDGKTYVITLVNLTKNYAGFSYDVQVKN